MWRCTSCSKDTYESRKGAKVAAKVNHPGERLAAYECLAHPGVWHYGHLRSDVVAGRVGRQVYVN